MIKFFTVVALMVGVWIALSLDPLKKLHDSYTSLRQEREQLALLERRVELLERKIRSAKALGADLEITLRQIGHARPAETVYIVGTEGLSQQTPTY
ncbi:MAG: hypothetical protein N2Z21_00440 [Candidatus Sumerlaeaceae bacterium]|nr:hypothetical protein [Candidatus Sumerlaeaceae bacterium]